MIAAAIGLLVVALVLLLVGVAKSSVTPLVLSVLSTVGACGLLAASFTHYRRTGSDAAAAPGGGAVPVGAVGGDRTVVTMVPTGWDAFAAKDAAALARTLGFDELQAARAHEVANGYRKTVLAAIDARLDDIVTTRRRVG